MGKPTIAVDGLRARLNGAYAKAKLEWMERYLRGGLSATQKKLHRVYVDLFAGPGVNVDPKTREEFTGGALRAITLVGNDQRGSPFTSAYLVNLDTEDHDALHERVERLSNAMALHVPRPNIFHRNADANVEVHRILAEIDVRNWVFVFADIEHPRQLPFTTLQALKSKGHQSVDLYVLFPLEMVINRKMTYDPSRRPIKLDRELDAFFGTDEWRAMEDARKTPAQGAELRDNLEDLYCRQLSTLWTNAGSVAQIRLAGDRTLYRMLFASSHESAVSIAESVAKRAAQRDELDLFNP